MGKVEARAPDVGACRKGGCGCGEKGRGGGRCGDIISLDKMELELMCKRAKRRGHTWGGARRAIATKVVGRLELGR